MIPGIDVSAFAQNEWHVLAQSPYDNASYVAPTGSAGDVCAQGQWPGKHVCAYWRQISAQPWRRSRYVNCISSTRLVPRPPPRKTDRAVEMAALNRRVLRSGDKNRPASANVLRWIALQSVWIEIVDRVIQCVGIEIRIVLVASRVGLREDAEVGEIVAGLVVVDVLQGSTSGRCTGSGRRWSIAGGHIRHKR